MRHSWLLVSDIDGTLTGDDDALAELMRRLAAERPRLGFGVASGRSPELVREAIEQFGLNEPDLIIASVGAEILGKGLAEKYRTHVAAGWERDAVVAALSGVPGVALQGSPGQGPYKVGYYAPPAAVGAARDALARSGVKARLIHSHGEFLDVLPERASKGQAVHFVATKLGVPLTRVVVAGDSGNDADMLTCGANAVVVANHDRELDPLLAGADVYRARGAHAAGVLEGLEHFGAL